VENNSPPGTLVAYVSVQDGDRGLNGLTQCHLLSFTSSFLLQPLTDETSQATPSVYKLVTTTSSPVAVHVTRVFVVTVYCEDHGQPALWSASNLTVLVPGPVYERESYAASVEENTGVGWNVLTVVATEADERLNRNITYMIIHEIDSVRGSNGDWVAVDRYEGGSNMGSTGGRYLSINRYSGAVTTRVNLNHERASMVVATVQATSVYSLEGGTVPLSRITNTTLTLIVLDDNDCPPVITSSAYIFNPPMNVARDSVIGQVTATDADSSPYNQFTWSLADPHKQFTVDLTTGDISTIGVINRDNPSIYYMTAVVVDTWPPYFSASVNVTVDVGPLDFREPVLIYPVDANNTVDITESLAVGVSFVRVFAWRADNMNSTMAPLMTSPVSHARVDDGAINRSSSMTSYDASNADILYSLEKSETNTVFQMNSLTGEISLIEGLTKGHSPLLFTLTVMASTWVAGGFQLTTRGRLFIRVSGGGDGLLGSLGFTGGALLSPYLVIIIIIISLTVVIGLVLLAAIILMMRRRRRRACPRGGPRHGGMCHSGCQSR